MAVAGGIGVSQRHLVLFLLQVVEYGKPSDLLASSTSKFKAMFDAVEKQQEAL